LKKGFYGHLVMYIMINLFMVFLMTFTTGEPSRWAVPAFGWGIGLASHYFRVFGFPFVGVGGKDWEEKELQKELEKEGYDLRTFRRDEDEDDEDEDDDDFDDDDDDDGGLDVDGPRRRSRAERSKDVIERQWRDEDFI